MKTKIGFISNSSSTSFLFVIKEDTKEDLKKILTYNKNIFEMSFINYDGNIIKTDADLIINRIVDQSVKQSLNYYIEKFEAVYEDYKKLSENDDYYFSYMSEFLKKKDIFEKIYNFGYKTVFQINFGDEDDNDINSIIMDYNNRFFTNLFKYNLYIDTIPDR